MLLSVSTETTELRLLSTDTTLPSLSLLLLLSSSWITITWAESAAGEHRKGKPAFTHMKERHLPSEPRSSPSHDSKDKDWCYSRLFPLIGKSHEEIKTNSELVCLSVLFDFPTLSVGLIFYWEKWKSYVCFWSSCMWRLSCRRSIICHIIRHWSGHKMGLNCKKNPEKYTTEIM